jgi:hypothetical protein
MIALLSDKMDRNNEYYQRYKQVQGSDDRLLDRRKVPRLKRNDANHHLAP